MTRTRFPRLAYNWISLLGVLFASVSGITLAVLLAIAFLFEESTNPYFGMFLYLVLPPVLVAGLILIPVGMVRQWRRWQRTGEEGELRWPIMDFNRLAHRNALFVFVLGTVVFVVMSAMGSYGAYHYTESVTFCGTTCHSVMHPEFTTYQSSPHARVSCAECHVGPGADWYVKSKLSGLYQVWATFREIYPQPIPTPIESLRPAQETCEQCHWPEKIFGAQQKRFNHYMYDQPNTLWPIELLIKTGGGDPASGQTAGIHWHMNIGAEVEYIARDAKRREIPWVRVSDRRTGRVTVYQDSANPLSEGEIAASESRRMDCMDCHNRPSHIYRSPDHAVDAMILKGRIDPAIPDIKRLAVESMTQEYGSVDEAKNAIANRLANSYRSRDDNFYESHRRIVDEAIAAVQEAYATNIFPDMEASWKAYPDNIGHMESVGCMRCHGGSHKSADGAVISNECDTCHTILSQGSGERAQVASGPGGLEFEHPEDIAEMWRETGCYECHAGSQP